jgi:hypothetical protein
MSLAGAGFSNLDLVQLNNTILAIYYKYIKKVIHYQYPQKHTYLEHILYFYPFLANAYYGYSTLTQMNLPIYHFYFYCNLYW